MGREHSFDLGLNGLLVLSFLDLGLQSTHRPQVLLEARKLMLEQSLGQGSSIVSRSNQQPYTHLITTNSSFHRDPFPPCPNHHSPGDRIMHFLHFFLPVARYCLLTRLANRTPCQLMCSSLLRFLMAPLFQRPIGSRLASDRWVGADLGAHPCFRLGRPPQNTSSDNWVWVKKKKTLGYGPQVS